MPELPEVETTRRGIEPHLLLRRIQSIEVHEPRLRWPVPAALQQLAGQRIDTVARRGKYLLLKSAAGTAVIHLGMSGSLRICDPTDTRRKHDHVEWFIDTGRVMRLHDPRRFGSVLWQSPQDPEIAQLARLGPEPLGNAFNGEMLYRVSRRKRCAIKVLLMNSQVVVGVGNIYANEALYMAGIRPGRAAGRVTRTEAEALAEAVRKVLSDAILQGGTTLRDFLNSAGEPGYFAQSLQVYDRTGQGCHSCGTRIQKKMIGQRSSFYCSSCQR